MPGTISGNFGLRKKPATLDFSGIIRNVEWALGPDVMTLLLEESRAFHPPESVTLEGLELSNIDPFSSILFNQHDDSLPIVTPSNPMSKQQVAHTFLWNRPPKKTNIEGGGASWKAFLFINLRPIKSFGGLRDATYDIKLHFPAGNIENVDGFTFWVYADPFGNPFQYYFDHPQTTGAIIDELGNTAIVTTPFATSEALRAAFLGFNTGSLPPWLAFNEPVHDTHNDRYNWKVTAKSYRRRKNFPLDGNLVPQWNENEAISSAVEQDFSLHTSIPARTLTITINFKTLAISMRKV